MVVAAPSRVWVEPDQSDIQGESFLYLDADFPLAVEVSAPVAVVIEAELLCAVDLTAEDAAMGCDGDVLSLPKPAADAAISVSAEAETIADRFITAPAVADIAAPFGVVVDYVFGESFFGFQGFSTTRVVVDAAADIAVTDDGATNDYEEWVVGANRPEFPFFFPAAFTDLSNAKLGDAEIHLDGSGTIDAVAGVARAAITIDREGLAVLLGLIQPLPFVFPLVFGIVEGFRATAAIRINPQFNSAVTVDASASVPISGDSSLFNSGFFPWVFPICLG